jgi:hypothetical protein
MSLAPRLLPVVFLSLLLLASCDKDKDRDREKDKEKPKPPPATEAKKDEAEAKPDAEGWISLFDGKTLKNWKNSEFGAQAEPRVEDGAIVLGVGSPLTGVTYTGKSVPKMEYEINLEAKLVDGSDFFCGLTFPVGESCASLICAGWGGSVTGISSIDHNDAANNSTARHVEYEKGKWYDVRMRIQETRLKAYIDDKEIINVCTKGKDVSTRWEIDNCKPFGLATYSTVGAIRNIRVRKLTAEEAKEAKEETEKEEKDRGDL